MKTKFKISLFVIAFFLIISIGLVFISKTKSKEVVNVSNVLYEIKDYGYHVNDNASSYYKNTFKSLMKLLENDDYDDEEYLSLVAKLFIIDLYSLDSKINKYEVTSSQYYYSDKQDMFKLKVIENFYNLMEDNSYDDRDQILPKVKNVEIVSIEDGVYTLGENEVDSKVVKVNISYEKDLNYDESGIITLVKESNKWAVVGYEGVN